MQASSSKPIRFQRSSVIVRSIGFALCLSAVVLLAFLISIDFEIEVGAVEIAATRCITLLMRFAPAATYRVIPAARRKTREYSLAYRTCISFSIMHLCSNVYLFIWRTILRGR